MKFVNIGFGNVVSVDKVVSIIAPDSAPIKRLVSDARDDGRLVDATYGRRTRAVLVTSSDYVILLSLQPETIAHRLNNSKLNGSKLNDSKLNGSKLNGSKLDVSD